ncbi:hypothetical protein EIP86_011171 [Pleurotus ostreatoroseus]|nr:hypothetical protein EIP86_011171 [Pleurotus ostreatoroseus]
MSSLSTPRHVPPPLSLPFKYRRKSYSYDFDDRPSTAASSTSHAAVSASAPPPRPWADACARTQAHAYASTSASSSPVASSPPSSAYASSPPRPLPHLDTARIRHPSPSPAPAFDGDRTWRHGLLDVDKAYSVRALGAVYAGGRHGYARYAYGYAARAGGPAFFDDMDVDIDLISRISYPSPLTLRMLTPPSSLLFTDSESSPELELEPDDARLRLRPPQHQHQLTPDTALETDADMGAFSPPRRRISFSTSAERDKPFVRPVPTPVPVSFLGPRAMSPASTKRRFGANAKMKNDVAAELVGVGVACVDGRGADADPGTDSEARAADAAGEQSGGRVAAAGRVDPTATATTTAKETTPPPPPPTTTTTSGRRTRSRPTLMDLLSPSPSRPSVPTTVDTGAAAAATLVEPPRATSPTPGSKARTKPSRGAGPAAVAKAAFSAAMKASPAIAVKAASPDTDANADADGDLPVWGVRPMSPASSPLGFRASLPPSSSPVKAASPSPVRASVPPSSSPVRASLPPSSSPVSWEDALPGSSPVRWEDALPGSSPVKETSPLPTPPSPSALLTPSSPALGPFVDGDEDEDEDVSMAMATATSPRFDEPGESSMKTEDREGDASARTPTPPSPALRPSEPALSFPSPPLSDRGSPLAVDAADEKEDVEKTGRAVKEISPLSLDGEGDEEMNGEGDRTRGGSADQGVVLGAARRDGSVGRVSRDAPVASSSRPVTPVPIVKTSKAKSKSKSRPPSPFAGATATAAAARAPSPSLAVKREELLLSSPLSSISSPSPREAEERHQESASSDEEDVLPRRPASKKRSRVREAEGGRKKRARVEEREHQEVDDVEEAPVHTAKTKKAASHRGRKTKAKSVVPDEDAEAEPDTVERSTSTARARSKPARSATPHAHPHSQPHPQPKKRTRRKRQRSLSSSPETHTRSARRVDWDAEAPLPVPELEGMIIETLATARATSLSAAAIYGALMAGRPALKTMPRRVPEPEHLRAAEDDTPLGAEAAPLHKSDWLHLLTTVLTRGHASSGIFGKVDSSASDSDADGCAGGGAAASPQHLSHKAALLAQWFYVPEKDADRERAGVIRTMMRGPGKRSETMKYKQYYWKPLGKISRWDPEDDL